MFQVRKLERLTLCRQAHSSPTSADPDCDECTGRNQMPLNIYHYSWLLRVSTAPRKRTGFGFAWLGARFFPWTSGTEEVGTMNCRFWDSVPMGPEQRWWRAHRKFHWRGCGIALLAGAGLLIQRRNPSSGERARPLLRIKMS